MITAPRGTVDLLPPDSRAWQNLETQLRGVAKVFGFGEIRTPMFEATELFVRGVGEATDIVEKEMYTFLDKGDRSMTLRPEWTAPVVRAMLEHKRLGQDAQRLFYIGPFFRYERPQAGRLRQAHQFGVEFFGAEQADADAEVILLATEALRVIGLKNCRLDINSIGDPACRAAYREKLLAYFRPHAAVLSEDSQRRLERNPMRILDSKAAVDQALIAGVPTLEDSLCEPCRVHFMHVRALLDAAGVTYEVNPRLVRGFDYYSRTVFEISSTLVGAQTAVCGGGRYDGLVTALGGPPTPAVGFGMGMERILMALASSETAVDVPRTGIQVIALGAAPRARMATLIPALRRASLEQRQGLGVFTDYGDRKILAQYKLGDRNGARMALVLGEDELAGNELIMRDLLTREEARTPLTADADIIAAVFGWYEQRVNNA
jgi:histidyl-tRNA synthetase